MIFSVSRQCRKRRLSAGRSFHETMELCLIRFSIVAVLLLSLTMTAVPARAETACAFESPPRVLLEEGDPHTVGSRLLQVWDVRDRSVLWSQTIPDAGSYRQFRDELAGLEVETDPVRLLDRSPTENNLIVMENAGDWIRPAGCLEMLLIGRQHGRLNTFETPTEFASIVLRSHDGDRLRVYYYTINHDGIGRMDPVVEPALQDKRDGWEVLIALHSHVFHPGQPEIDGILAPSEPDADFHVRFHETSGVREAWITNGVDTVRMPASSFHLFKRPADGGAVGNRSD